MADARYSPLAPLDGGHERTAFDCGVSALNLYLCNYALQNQRRGIVRNYVTVRAESRLVVGYYSLVYASLAQKLLPPELVKGLGKYDIPVMLLARLTVDRREQGQGLGKALLKDAILRTMQAAEIAGLKLLLVFAKDEAAAGFYRKHGFEADLRASRIDLRTFRSKKTGGLVETPDPPSGPWQAPCSASLPSFLNISVSSS